MITSTALKYRKLFTILAVAVFIFTITGNLWSKAYGQDIHTDTPTSEPAVTETPFIEVISPYFSIEHTTLPDGTPVLGTIINGPPTPPPKYKAEIIASIKPITSAIILPNFPSFSWVYGCSSVSGAMIAAYYDRNGYPNMYTGPTNGGVMPLTDTSWPLWSDGFNSYPNNPLIASHNGVDGRSTPGSIEDYWISYLSELPDPYITGGWTQHTWGTAIGDYMKTSQSTNHSVDGETHFWIPYNNAKFTCSDMEGAGYANKDGTYGRKLFYEARGYTLSDCYNQRTDNEYPGGFSLADFQAEIDAGYPVLINLRGHSMVGYGYEGSTIYIRDTWSNDPGFTPTMTWGGSYAGMVLYSVSVIHLTPAANQSPTDVLLSNSSIEENQPINTVVGTLSSADPNVGDTFTYSLVSGEGDTGNGSFNISGNQLRSSAVFDFETQNSYSIRIRTTDQGGLYFEKAFIITITPVVVNPIADLAISNPDSTDPIDPESELTYTLTVSNLGPNHATSIVVIDTLPQGVTFISASPSCSEISFVVTCNIGNLSSGSTVQILITVLAPENGGVITNTTTVTGNELDPNPDNNIATENTIVVYESAFNSLLPIIIR